MVFVIGERRPGEWSIPANQQALIMLSLTG
jgi:hypothetical protein